MTGGGMEEGKYSKCTGASILKGEREFFVVNVLSKENLGIECLYWIISSTHSEV